MFFLKKIISMASEVSPKDLQSSGLEVGEDEKVVGKLPDNLKGLYIVLKRAQEKTKSVHARIAKEIAEYGVQDPPAEKVKSLMWEHMCVHLEEDLISKAFWTCVRFEFPKDHINEIGLRANWQVVTVDQTAKAKRALSELIDAMFH